MKHAWEQAEAAKDHRTATLIDQFLKQDFPRLPVAELNLPSLPADLLEDFKKMREMLLLVPPALRETIVEQMLEESLPDHYGIPPELGKILLKTLLLSGGGSGKPLDFLDDRSLPFDFPLPRQSRRKPKKR